METFKTYINDINNCLQEIINIFSLQEVVVHFELLDDINAIDNHNLDDKSESLPDLIVYKDQSIGDLPTPKARKYYDFKGWFLNFERDDYYTPPEVYWSNEVEDYSKVVAPGNLITLYAKWELKTIDIKLDPCGGTVFPETIPVKYYETFEKELSKVQIAKKNSKFTEWISNTNETISGASELEPGITSLFAQYVTAPCTLKFDYSYKIKGVISDPAKSILCANISALSNFQIGDSFNLAENREDDRDNVYKNFIQNTTLTANGYTFKGWSLLKNNPDVVFTVYLYEDITLYAYWEPISYTINYKYRNDINDTPIYRQKLLYGQAAALIPYKIIFNEDAPSNFKWEKTKINHTNIELDDNELVENLLSTDSSVVTLYRRDGIPTINAALYKVENTKNYIEDEEFNGIDFNLYFNNGLILHPSKISPSRFKREDNQATVTCYYGDDNLSIECRVNADTSHTSLLSVEIYDIDEMKDEYEYGERLNFYGVFARETYTDGSTKEVYFNSYPDNFITYPDKQTILKKPLDLYFGYKSSFDGSVWPHAEGNKAMWACTEISKHIKVSSGEKNIAITSLPRKLNYIEGEKLSLDGIELMLEMTTLERFTLALSDCLFEPDTSTELALSDTTISVSLSSNENISATYDISITPKQVATFKLNFPNDYSFIVPSDVSDVSSINMSNVSVEVIYDSRTTTTYLYSELSDQLSLICNNLSSRYGEINVNAYFEPEEYNSEDRRFGTNFAIKKQFPSYLFSFVTNSEENMYIHTLSCENENFEISLECYLSANTPIKDIFFTNNGSFSDSINISKNYKYFIVRGTDFDSDISDITQYNNYVIFNSEIIRRSPEINFINQNISIISNFVPPYTFYQSNLSSILLHNGSVEFIDDYGFYNDVNLTSINFPSSLTYIGQNAFSNCENILSMRFNSENPPEILENSFGSTPSDYTGNGISEPTIIVYTDTALTASKTVERLIRYTTSSYISVEIGQTNNFTALSSRPSYSYYLIDNDNFK